MKLWPRMLVVFGVSVAAGLFVLYFPSKQLPLPRFRQLQTYVPGSLLSCNSHYNVIETIVI
jgi:hypothetical protein